MRSIVLLAAGQGSRLRPLTDKTPKCLLQVGGVTVLDTILSSVLQTSEREIVIVAGHFGDLLEEYIKNNYERNRIRVVHNKKYASDVNILSVDIGVDALIHPENGYTIIETDILMQPSGWQSIINAGETHLSSKSFWVTKGRYNKTLTGGIVHASSPDEFIDQIDYVPEYNKNYDDWYKMVGVLSVAPQQVLLDRYYRKIAIKNTLRQYYLIPWMKNLKNLDCVVFDMGDWPVKSFNTIEDFSAAVGEYLDQQKG